MPNSSPTGAATNRYRIETMCTGPFQTNLYLLHDSQTRRCWLFDCGFEGEEIISWIEASGASLQAIWLTHGHIDHVADVELVADHFKVPFYLHSADQPMLETLAMQGRLFGLSCRNVRSPDSDITPALTQIGELACDIRHVPGHSPGSVVFWFPALEVLIAGDTVFDMSIGRTDLPGGDHATLLNAIHGQIMTLPPETRILPGHMGPTTVGREAASNPYLH